MRARTVSVEVNAERVACLQAIGRRIGSLEAKLEELHGRSPEVRRFVAYQLAQRTLRDRQEQEMKFLGYCVASDARVPPIGTEQTK